MAQPYMPREQFTRLITELIAERPSLSNRKMTAIVKSVASQQSTIAYSVQAHAAKCRSEFGIKGTSLQGSHHQRVASVDWLIYSRACRRHGLQPAYPCSSIDYIIPPLWTGEMPPTWPDSQTVGDLSIGVRRERTVTAAGMYWRVRSVRTGKSVWHGRAHSVAGVLAAMGAGCEGVSSEPRAEHDDALDGADNAAAVDTAETEPETEPETERREPTPRAKTSAERRSDFLEALADLAWTGMDDHDIQAITIGLDGIEFEARVTTTVRGGLKRSKR